MSMRHTMSRNDKGKRKHIFIFLKIDSSRNVFTFQEDYFAVDTQQSIMQTDAGTSSRPVVVEVTDPDGINQAFDGITYNKVYRQTSNIRRTFIGQYTCWSLRCSWSIACRPCSSYIFILDLTHGSNGLGKGNYKTRRKTFKCYDLGRLIFDSSYSTVHWSTVLHDNAKTETVLKRRCCHFDEIFFTSCTESCHFDNFQCSSDENFVKIAQFLFQYNSGVEKTNYNPIYRQGGVIWVSF